MNWKLVFAHHEACSNKVFSTIATLEESGFPALPAMVPGNFELDLMKAGLLEDLYYSTNTLKAQELEDVHVWYYTTVKITSPEQYLYFAGVDTFSDIYVNGKLVKSTDNMFLPYEVDADWIIGDNEVVVHIKPAVLETRKYPVPVACNSLKYSASSLYARKAASMYGWDIMPRIVSAGLWKGVELKSRKPDKINEVYLATNEIDLENRTAKVRFYVNVDMGGVFATDYTVKVDGICGDSVFKQEDTLWHNSHAFEFEIENCKFWWPKNVGKQNLYNTTVTLYKKGELVDTYTCKLGIRTVELELTDTTDSNANGKFGFKVNGKKIFAMGTNWVPLDAFHSNDINRLQKALEMMEDIGCNIVRCWGGNVYEADEFYDFCDEKGIMVWQDFGMGCAVYPDEDWFCKALEEEAVYQIKRLRNHASLILWAGDNECDLAYESWNGFRRNPNRNKLTREVLANAVERHDYTRPYLASSPFISEAAYQQKALTPENHLWGPRDYFKGDFYRNTFCHFASETGYHGFNSPKSLERFLKEPTKIFEKDWIPTDEYIMHATSMEIGVPDAPFVYRIKLAYDQVVTLFGSAEKDMDDFIRQSQISQAEAKKYFIEKFRIGKWDRTGIIWWNLVDGWPQVSAAIVDYYYVKKLAYHYIKRIQQPVCLMFDEPENGKIRLVGVNDLTKDAEIKYTVKKVTNATEDPVVMCGQVCVSADSSVGIDLLPIEEGEKEFYLIEWEYEGQLYKNHYFTNIIDIDYQKYMSALKKCGMDEFEGF